MSLPIKLVKAVSELGGGGSAVPDAAPITSTS